MSLSRPVTFPLLKLPFLCIECVIKSWDFFDIILFALTSKRTRLIVKMLKIPVVGNNILLSKTKSIKLNEKPWYIVSTGSQSLLPNKHKYLMKCPLVLQNNAIPLYTTKTDYIIESYTDEDEFIALKKVMEFLNEVFKCTIREVKIQGNNFPESGDIGVKSTVNFCMENMYGPARSQKLKLLLENLEVTDLCSFRLMAIDKDFHCDPKLLKCKKLVFWSYSADWVTREILLQFEVPQLIFYHFPFSVEDIVSFVTNWFHSDNKKLEYLYIEFRSRHVSLEKFQTEELNSLPFSERTRVPPSESFSDIDFSKGLEIIRHDELQATVHVGEENFMFYVWHDQ